MLRGLRRLALIGNRSEFINPHNFIGPDHRFLRSVSIFVWYFPMLDKCTIIGTLGDDEQRQAATSSFLPYDDRA